MYSVATSQVSGHTKSQQAQHEKSSGFTYIWPALPNLKETLESSRLKGTKSGASATAAGRSRPCGIRCQVFVRWYVDETMSGPLCM